MQNDQLARPPLFSLLRAHEAENSNNSSDFKIDTFDVATFAFIWRQPPVTYRRRIVGVAPSATFHFSICIVHFHRSAATTVYLCVKCDSFALSRRWLSVCEYRLLFGFRPPACYRRAQTGISDHWIMYIDHSVAEISTNNIEIYE